MEISKEQFFQAASKLDIGDENKKALWKLLEADQPKDSFMAKLFYYFGALIVILAMTWFMGLGWTVFGSGWLFFISIFYAAGFTLTGKNLWKNEKLKTPAGLLITMAVCMTPLAICGLGSYWEVFSIGSFSFKTFDSAFKSGWVWMEIGTILSGLLALRFYPFPFLTAPIWFAAWSLIVELTPLLVETESREDLEKWISLAVGALFVVGAYIVDRKNKPQYSFWGYLLGTLTFWVNLGVLCAPKGQLALFAYLGTNILMMIGSIFLQRKVLLVCGGLGTFFYFAYQAYIVFKDSILFPFVLILLGLMTIYLGWIYQKNSKGIERWLLSFLKGLQDKAF